jgi:L-threonylcarbamoyladenylate synthase
MAIVAIAELIQAAKLGAVISFPTDTVAALAVKPEFANQIYEIKQRDRSKPLILMAASWQELAKYLDLVTNPEAVPIWEAVAKKYLPGALTLVLPANLEGRSLNYNNPGDNLGLGVRIPNHQLAIAVLQQTGALLTTSANLSGQEPLCQSSQIAEAFPQVSVLEAAELGLESGSPSTVVAWTNSGWEVLRQSKVFFDLI